MQLSDLVISILSVFVNIFLIFDCTMIS